MENSQEESKPSLPDRASPQVIPGETGCGGECENEEFEGRTGLEDYRQEIQGGAEETKLVLLPVNPYLVHVYWEISDRDREEVGGLFSRLGPRAQPVLRFYDTTELHSADSARGFEVATALGAGKWYVRLENPASSYCIDLGLRMPGGSFRRLARSNVAEMPKAGPSDRLEERYLVVEGDHPPPEGVVDPQEFIAESPTAPPYSVQQRQEASAVLQRQEASVVLQRQEASWPERSGASTSAPVYADHPGEEGNVAAEQRVSHGRPLYDDWQGNGEIDRELEGAKLSRAPLPENVERQLAEFYQQRGWECVWWEPGVRGREESGTATNRCADLTEMGEGSFRAGLSSGQKLP